MLKRLLQGFLFFMFFGLIGQLLILTTSWGNENSATLSCIFTVVPAVLFIVIIISSRLKNRAD